MSSSERAAQSRIHCNDVLYVIAPRLVAVQNACQIGCCFDISTPQGIPNIIELVGIFWGQIRGPARIILNKLHIHLGNLLTFTNELHATTVTHLVSPENPPTSVEDPVYKLSPAPLGWYALSVCPRRHGSVHLHDRIVTPRPRGPLGTRIILDQYGIGQSANYVPSSEMIFGELVIAVLRDPNVPAATRLFTASSILLTSGDPPTVDHDM